MSLHTKYRPKSFAEIRGNKGAVESLKATLALKEKPHAFLFIGESGLGKTTMARVVANHLGKKVRIIELNAADDRGIEGIRTIIKSNRSRGFFDGDAKVYILDECHQITRDAQEALLKITEEPSDFLYFIFCTTNPEKMLPTLKSRCYEYELKPLVDTEMEELLEYVMRQESIDTPPGVKEMIAQAGKGVPRQALNYLGKVCHVKSPKEAASLLNQPGEYALAEQVEEPAPQMTPSNDKVITSPGAAAIPAETPVESSNDASSPDELLSSLETWSHLQSLDIKIEWVVDRLVPKKGITVVFGKGGIGKTWLMMGMARSIESGLPFLGFSTIRTPIVYVDFENPLSILVSRIKKLGDAEGVYFWRGNHEGMKPPKLDSDGWDIYKRLPKGSVLIFDTLRAAHDRDENTSRDMGLIMGRLKELRDMGFTIIVLHHTPKNCDRVAKGSTAILDLADHSIGLVKIKKKRDGQEIIIDDDEDDDDAVYLFGGREKTRYERYNLYLSFNPDRGFELAPDPQEDILKEMHRILVESGAMTKTAFNEACEGLRLTEKKLRKLIGLGQGRFWDISIPGPRNVQYVTPKAIPGSLVLVYSGADLPNCPGTAENGPGTNDPSGIPDKVEADKGQDPRKP